MGEGQGGGEVITATFTDVTQIEKPEQTLKEIGFTLSSNDLKEEGWTLERRRYWRSWRNCARPGNRWANMCRGNFIEVY